MLIGLVKSSVKRYGAYQTRNHLKWNEKLSAKKSVTADNQYVPMYEYISLWIFQGFSFVSTNIAGSGYNLYEADNRKTAYNEKRVNKIKYKNINWIMKEHPSHSELSFSRTHMFFFLQEVHIV